MGHTVSCAFRDCTPPAPSKSITDVMDVMQTTVSQTCASTQSVTQAITCPVLASACSNLTIACGAEASQSFTCQGNLADIAAKAAEAMTKNPKDISALRKSTGTDNLSIADLRSAISQQLLQSCNTNERAVQQLNGSTVCSTSRNINIAFAAHVDQQTLCLFDAANNMLTKAYSQTAEVKTTRVVNDVITVACVVLAMGVVLAVFFGAEVGARSA